MHSTLLKRAGWILVLGGGLAGAIWFAWPRPIGVDMAVISKGPIEVTIDDEAKTRVRHIYTVSAPIAGTVLRISHHPGIEGGSLHVGDQVTANETVVAVMQPATPGFIDVRSRGELQATLTAAEAAVASAEAEIRRIEASLDFSRSELRRAEALLRTGATTAKAVDKARFEVAASEAALTSARAQLEVQRSERAMVAARLLDPSNVTVSSNPGCCIQLRAPVSGRVLKIIQESEAVVPAGAPLVEIGDPLDLEVVAELLSTDAVRISPDSPVLIDGWGGLPIHGRVTRVDPAGFLKVSALGIEEQRVRTTIDFTDPPETWSRLGHDYRVIVHITIWSAQEVLTVPVGALFRQGEDWAVFAVNDERARVTRVKIGHRNDRMAELLADLSEGDRVVLHPSDRIRDGILVSEREGG